MMVTVLDTSNQFHNQKFGSAELRLQNYHYELEDSSERSSAEDASLEFLGGAGELNEMPIVHAKDRNRYQIEDNTDISAGYFHVKALC